MPLVAQSVGFIYTTLRRRRRARARPARPVPSSASDAGSGTVPPPPEVISPKTERPYNVPAPVPVFHISSMAPVPMLTSQTSAD